MALTCVCPFVLFWSSQKIGWGKKVAKPLTPMYPPGMGPGGQLSGAQPGLGQTFLGMNVPQGPGGQSYGAPDNSGRVIVVEPPSSGPSTLSKRASVFAARTLNAIV